MERRRESDEQFGKDDNRPGDGGEGEGAQDQGARDQGGQVGQGWEQLTLPFEGWNDRAG